MSTATPVQFDQMEAYRMMEQAKELTVSTVSARQLCQCGCGGVTSPYKTTAHGHRAGQMRMFIGKHGLRGGMNRNWNGGKTTNGRGYVRILSPEHPRASAKGYVLEHVVIAEKALGRGLPPRADVHHVNGIRNDNRHSNLVICEDRGYHFLLHRRQRAYEATGNPDSVMCVYCKQWGLTGDGAIEKHSGRDHCHRDCRNAYQRSRRQEGGR